MASSKKQQKEMIVIAVYHIKRNGATVYRVRSNQPNKNGRVEGTDQEERNGLWYDAHNVTVLAGRVSGCTCKGSQFKAKCYHRDGVQLLENSRYASRKAAKVAQQEVKPSVQPVVSPVLTEERYTMSEALLAMLAPKTNVVDIAERGALNGAQHAAGFWGMLPSRAIA